MSLLILGAAPSTYPIDTDYDWEDFDMDYY